MMIHRALRLARAIVASRPQGTPVDWGPAVIVSSTIGTSIVSFDGGRTELLAFNHDHTKSLPVGTVVHVLTHGTQRWVIGANPT